LLRAIFTGRLQDALTHRPFPEASHTRQKEAVSAECAQAIEGQAEEEREKDQRLTSMAERLRY
jgi:hypothetical protein